MKNSLIFRFRLGILFLLSLCFTLSCSTDSLDNGVESTIDLTAQKADTSLIEGNYIVILSTQPGKKNHKALAALEALTKEVGKMPEAKISRKYSHALTGFAAKLTNKQVEILKNDPRVEAIEQDSPIYPTGELSVQEYSNWGLDRIDQREGPLDRSYAHSATGAGVTAYLVDTGIRFNHSEFGGRATLERDFVYEEERENTDPSQEPGEDCWDHGTAVAAVLGGAQSGVAKNVDLKSVRVWGCEGSAPRSRLIAAVDWITEIASPPAVVNMTGSHADSLVAIAIENSIQTGLVYVGVAGSQNIDGCEIYPPDLSGRLSVGGSDINDKRVWNSNYGECVDIYAPGESIYSASNKDDNSFSSYSGTSMASPFVAGVAALYLEVNRQATPAQTKAAIVNNSTPNAISDVPSGSNNLLYSLWETVEFTPPPPPDLKLAATGDKIRSDYVANLTWDPTESPYIALYIDGIRDSEHLNDGEEQITLPKKGKDATYNLEICEVSYDNCSEEVVLVFGSGSDEPVNSQPSAGFTFSTNLLDVQFTDTSTDPDASIIEWNWDFGDGTFSAEQNPFHSYGQAGTYAVQLSVSNDAGNTDSITKNITVDNEEPEPAPYQLSALGYKVKGQWHTDLSWTPSDKEVVIYRNGIAIKTVSNSGTFTDATNNKGSGSLSYQICDPGSTSSCSNEVMVEF